MWDSLLANVSKAYSRRAFALTLLPASMNAFETREIWALSYTSTYDSDSTSVADVLLMNKASIAALRKFIIIFFLLFIIF